MTALSIYRSLAVLLCLLGTIGGVAALYASEGWMVGFAAWGAACLAWGVLFARVGRRDDDG